MFAPVSSSAAASPSSFSPPTLFHRFRSVVFGWKSSRAIENKQLTSFVPLQPVPLARSQIQTQIREQQLIALGFTTAIDAPNRVTTPKESFVASEGIYHLREEVTLSVPPPHPSEPLIMQPNPIGTNALPVTAGSQAVILSAMAPRTITATDSGSIASGISGHSSISDSAAAAAGIYSPLSPLAKRKKPKNNIAKTNSSFVSRIITHDNLQKRLTERKSEDVYAFVNVSRAYEWLDLTTPEKSIPLAKLLFTRAHPTCHDINPYTRTHDHIDVIIGFSTGDIIWFECYSQKYMRLNKQGAINNTPAQQIRWIPRSENTFVTLFDDGSIVLMDKDREDTQFPPPNPVPQNFDRDNPHANGFGHASKVPPPRLKVHKSLLSSTLPVTAGKKEREAAARYNPLAYWELTDTLSTAFDFSHDGKLLAVTTMQGHLALLAWEKEVLSDVFTGYYGGLGCLAFSPDSRYLLCGGQDDMVSIFSVPERRLVGRGVGHHSWVTGLAFDPYISTDRAYRFGSVGDDGRLLLWELSSGTLVMPKQQTATKPGHDRSGSLSSPTNPTASSISLVRTASTIYGPTSYHPILPRRECPMLAPIVNVRVDDDPLCQIHFREREIMTTCKEGRPMQKAEADE